MQERTMISDMKVNMKKKLWQNTASLNQFIEKYTSSDDVLLDQNLVIFDIYGSLAHAQMLKKQDLINSNDLSNIRTGLLKILKLHLSGKYVLTLGDEDVHTRIENDLTNKYPESGAKLHTGRSRNDQVLVDIRLYTKVQLIEIALSLLETTEGFLDQATKLEQLPMPGMTHMQPAMLSSFGLWLGAFAESLLDDLSLLKATYDLNNQSPLGSGAAYGVTLPLDRDYTAKLLDFAKVQNNALYCQNSRGKIESAVLHTLTQIMATLNKFASDSLLFTTEPFSFISFAKELGTGSSIMPQKQNWDALELMRAKYHQIVSMQLQLSTSLANLPSGYNRDLQQTKGSLLSSISTTLDSLQATILFVNTLKADVKNINKHLPKELFAAHWTYELMQQKQIPFRQAYMYVKDHLREIPYFDSKKMLAKSASRGSTGDLRLNDIQTVIEEKRRHWTNEKKMFAKVIKKLIEK